MVLITAFTGAQELGVAPGPSGQNFPAAHHHHRLLPERRSSLSAWLERRYHQVHVFWILVKGGYYLIESFRVGKLCV